MDFTAPVSKFMTTKLVTVVPGDHVFVVKEIFSNHRIHHIPVVRFKKLVGLVSKADFLHFIKGKETTPDAVEEGNKRLDAYTVEDIMTKGIATLESNERMNVALQLFLENLFHAIPIVDNDELVGMLTTFDIIKLLVEEDDARIKAV